MKNKIIQPLSAGFCATVLAIAGSVTANVAASAVLPSKAFALASTSNSGEPDSQLPPVRETLTREQAEALPGCEAYFDSAKHEFVIRPKDGASEGVISYSLDNKKADFEAIRKVLIFKGDSDEVPVRFDKRVYIYDSTNPSANDTLFYQVHVKTINITPNLSIKFAKNLATFFMQNYNKDADHLHYIKGVENWDTSHVESMEKMFNLASQLEGKLDLSKWDVSGADKLNLMFSGVGNDNFVLDFSNKKFKNSADVTNMFNSFRGVLIANNWTVADPNGSSNPIQKLMNSTSSILTHWNGSAYTGPSWHLLITDNPTILDKNKTAKYKFYKKVKVIYKVNGTEKSVELELPAVYDSRIDENGKPDVSKAASSDPMKVIKPQIKEAIQKAITQLRTENPSLNLPENVIPVPVKEILDSDSPAALFQDYYLGLVKEQVVKAKTTYKADTNLEYKKVEYDTQPQDGKKQVITGAMKNGVWDPDATSEKEITKVVNGVARVGNQTTTVTVLEPGITYVADGNIAYNTTETQSEGVKGTSTSIDTYEVNSETGLTNTLDHHDMRIKKATNKVVKVGNKQVTTETIEPGTTYEADSSLEY
ncbi:BspA family leucine-rich repeat surface protein, partial [Gardnerella greenwoodii]|uniref:BspA family leucine-rich repeat surface protein n=1 Tax=Gardnerella greenwoodii TaxID=2914925 RepID=UPI0039EECD35